MKKIFFTSFILWFILPALGEPQSNSSSAKQLKLGNANSKQSVSKAPAEGSKIQYPDNVKTLDEKIRFCIDNMIKTLNLFKNAKNQEIFSGAAKKYHYLSPLRINPGLASVLLISRLSFQNYKIEALKLQNMLIYGTSNVVQISSELKLLDEEMDLVIKQPQADFKPKEDVGCGFSVKGINLQNWTGGKEKIPFVNIVGEIFNNNGQFNNTSTLQPEMAGLEGLSEAAGIPVDKIEGKNFEIKVYGYNNEPLTSEPFFVPKFSMGRSKIFKVQINGITSETIGSIIIDCE